MENVKQEQEIRDIREEIIKIKYEEGKYCYIDGIHYLIGLSKQIAIVTDPDVCSNGDNNTYSGTVNIPEKVEYEGAEYLVTVINYLAFCNSKVEEVVIPSSVIMIAAHAFEGCEELRVVKIPYGVKHISEEAFAGCNNLKEIIIPTSVTDIDIYAFVDCAGLKSITIPNSVTKIGYGAFAGCDELEEITVADGNEIYDSREGCNAIIETGGNKLVVACKNTVIPKSVKSIGYHAFASCKDGMVEIPEHITKIGRSIFKYCNISKVTVAAGNKVYDSREDCNAVIETKSNTLIAGCKNTTIPNSVTKIKDYAFSGIYDLEKIVIPNNVINIGDGIFSDCFNLKEITIPNSVTDIEYAAFSDCYSLEKVSIPNTVERIDRFAFYNCCKLKEIAIPNSLTNIMKMSFMGCGITSVIIPDSITSIRNNTFSHCHNLASVTIPSSVKEIEYLAFSCCDLTSVTSLSPIPPVITTSEYGYSAFYESGYTKATLHVPVGCKAAYEQAPYWKDFLNILDDIQT